MQWNDPRVSALLLGRRAVRTVPLPGSFSEEGGEPLFVGVRVLLESEIDECRLDAIQHVQTLAKKRNLEAADMLAVDSELVDREVQRAIVFRAFIAVAQPDDADGGEGEPAEKPDPRKPQEPKRFFPALQAVRQLDSVILRALFEMYLDHHNYVNPLKDLSDAETRELADALSKGQTETAILGLYDAASLRRLLHSLASRLKTSPTGS